MTLLKLLALLLDFVVVVAAATGVVVDVVPPGDVGMIDTAGIVVDDSDPPLDDTAPDVLTTLGVDIALLALM